MACLQNSNDIHNFLACLYTPCQETTLSASFLIFIHAPGPAVTSSNLHLFNLEMIYSLKHQKEKLS